MKIRLLSIVLLLVSLSGIMIYQQMPDDKLHIYALDVGQGDSFLIKTEDSKYILVDSGMNFEVIKEIQKVLPYWERTLDLVILTHPDQDHVGGFPKILEVYTVGAIIYWPINNSNLAFIQLKEAVKHGITYYALTSKNDFRIGCCTYFDILWPDQPLDLETKIDNVNDTSLSFVLNVGGFSMFFGGDLGHDLEEKLFSEKFYDLDILKVGHHGSKHSTSDRFLDLSRPEIAVIGVGENNFGHPTKEVLDSLANANIKVYRTDLDGTLDIEVSDLIKVKSF